MDHKIVCLKVMAKFHPIIFLTLTYCICSSLVSADVKHFPEIIRKFPKLPSKQKSIDKIDRLNTFDVRERNLSRSAVVDVGIQIFNTDLAVPWLKTSHKADESHKYSTRSLANVKRTVQNLQNDTDSCEIDGVTLCRRQRHPKCSVLFPASGNENDRKCRIEVTCRHACSATCFAVRKAFPLNMLLSTLYDVKVAVFGQNGEVKKDWWSRSRPFVVPKVTNFLQNHIGYSTFHVKTSYNCSNQIECSMSREEMQNLTSFQSS